MASMTHRVQRSYGHGWEGKADHLPVPALYLRTSQLVPLSLEMTSRCFRSITAVTHLDFELGT